MFILFHALEYGMYSGGRFFAVYDGQAGVLTLSRRVRMTAPVLPNKRKAMAIKLQASRKWPLTSDCITFLQVASTLIAKALGRL